MMSLKYCRGEGSSERLPQTGVYNDFSLVTFVTHPRESLAAGYEIRSYSKSRRLLRRSQIREFDVFYSNLQPAPQLPPIGGQCNNPVGGGGKAH